MGLIRGGEGAWEPGGCLLDGGENARFKNGHARVETRVLKARR